jgi:hypothetical protein
MAKAGPLAVQRQLQRELEHIGWLEQNMPRSSQLRASRRKVLVLRTRLRVELNRSLHDQSLQ